MANVENRLLAVSWEQHRRFSELCKNLGIQLVVFEFGGNRWIRYLILAAQTLLLLMRARPKVLLIQNPSLVLALICSLLRNTVWNGKLIVDAHNEAVDPFVNNTPLIRKLARYCHRAADATIVTNQELAEKIDRGRGRVVVLPDPLPDIAAADAMPLEPNQPLHVLVICTYAADEPIREIVEAAREVGQGFRFSFTGRFEKLPDAYRATFPPNIIFTGFLPESAYVEKLRSSHVVLDLSTMPNCLVCGSYEALAAGKPMVLTDSPAGRRIFAGVATFADNSPDSIRKALLELRSRYVQLSSEMPAARKSFITHWRLSAGELASELAKVTT